MMPPHTSLALRLTALAAGGSLVALILAGAVMSTLQRAGAERGFDQRLALLVVQLFADYTNGRVADDTAHFANPAFSLPGSGWYWVVADPQTGEALLASASLFDPLPAPRTSDGPTGLLTYTLADTEPRLRLAEQIFSLDGNAVLIRVAAPTAGLDEEVAGFARALLITLALMWIALMGLALLQVRIGLAPLGDLRRDVARIRGAEIQRIDSNYPDEVGPLVDELNALFETNASIVARARSHVGNLAHALKTPLAVILNATEKSGSGDNHRLIRSEAQAIEGRVRVYLDRARRAALNTGPQQATALKPVVDRLVRVMAKLNIDRDLSFEVADLNGIKLRVEEEDLEEMLGNLLENACRAAKSALSVSLERSRAEASVRIFIDDDGPGLTEDQTKQVLRRGQRLDEAAPGSGLGLSIVKEMAELYGGSIELGRAPLGGLRATLELPAIATIPPDLQR